MSDIFTLCKNGDEEGVRRMIAADRAVVHARHTYVSCLSPAIPCRIYILSIMSILISSHISITQPNRTPLHFAAEKGHTSIVQLLLQAGADVHAKDSVSIY